MGQLLPLLGLSGVVVTGGQAETMQQQADEDELGLSSAALAALKEFALENDMLGPEGGDGDIVDVRLQVQERMDVKERSHEFRFSYGDDGDDEQVCIALTGVNPELGQTLASTGLTVWRAAQEMARFMWEHRKWFVGKSVLELGAGLGLCGVLASKLCTGGTVVITDGGEEFTDSALDALRLNLEKNACNLDAPTSPPPARGEDGHDAAAAAAAAVAGGGGSGARVALERLTWGEHTDFLGRYGNSFGSGTAEDGNGGAGGERGRGGFDYVVAADVIYEEEAVSPLLHTVVDILRLRQNAINQERERDSGHSPPSGEDCDKHNHHSLPAAPAEGEAQQGDRLEGREEEEEEEILPPQPGQAGPPGSRTSTFLLAFARRNVSIERVLAEAEGLGLAWRVPEDFEPATASENIYMMSLR